MMCQGEYQKAIADLDEAIRLDSKCSLARRVRAQILACCPEARYRNGPAAVESATKACELTNWNDLICISTLASAYAEKGDFSAAIRWQKTATDLGPQFGQDADFMRARLELFEADKPDRDEPAK